MPVGRNARSSNLACNRRSAVAVALTRAFAKHATQRMLPNICDCPFYVPRVSFSIGFSCMRLLAPSGLRTLYSGLRTLLLRTPYFVLFIPYFVLAPPPFHSSSGLRNIAGRGFPVVRSYNSQTCSVQLGSLRRYLAPEPGLTIELMKPTVILRISVPS